MTIVETLLALPRLTTTRVVMTIVGTLMALPRLTTTRVVTTIVGTHTALLVTMTLLAANAIARERLPVAERMLVTHYPRKEVAPVVKIPTVPLSRSGHLLW